MYVRPQSAESSLRSHNSMKLGKIGHVRPHYKGVGVLQLGNMDVWKSNLGTQSRIKHQLVNGIHIKTLNHWAKDQKVTLFCRRVIFWSFI